MQRGCMKNAALVLAQKTFSIQRKLNFNFTQKNFFCQNCVCKMVDPKFETGFWPLYWVSSGGWWLYGLVYPHRFSGSQEKNLNWLLVLNMLGFINKNQTLTFFAVMAATHILLYTYYWHGSWFRPVLKFILLRYTLLQKDINLDMEPQWPKGIPLVAKGIDLGDQKEDHWWPKGRPWWLKEFPWWSKERPQWVQGGHASDSETNRLGR